MLGKLGKLPKNMIGENAKRNEELGKLPKNMIGENAKRNEELGELGELGKLPYNMIRKIAEGNEGKLRTTHRTLIKLIPKNYASTYFFDKKGLIINEREFKKRLNKFKVDTINIKAIEKYVKDKNLKFGDIIIHPALKNNGNKNDIKYKIGLVNNKSKIKYANYSEFENFLIPEKFQNLGIKYFSKSPLYQMLNFAFINEFGAINVVKGNIEKITKPNRFATRFVNNVIKSKKITINNKEKQIGANKITLPYKVLSLKLK